MALEYLLSTNEYNKPKVLSGRDALATKLIILLNMKPGTDPLHPEMGIDVCGRYRYCYEEDVSMLQEEIDNQIATYLPLEYSTGASITATWDDGEIDISITIDGTAYNFETSDNGVVFDLDDLRPESDEDIPDNEDDDDDGEDYGALINDDALNYPGDEGALN